MRRLALGLLLSIAACSTEPAALPAGEVAQSVAAAADRNGVPRDLMLAVGVVEGGLMLAKVRMPDADDHVPVAGVLELRHGAFDSLARGAALIGVDELTLARGHRSRHRGRRARARRARQAERRASATISPAGAPRSKSSRA